MKIHVSRYIVGVTTCVAAQVSYATGIEGLETSGLKEFAKAIQTNIANYTGKDKVGVDKHKPFKKTITDEKGTKEVKESIAEHIGALLKSEDVKEVKRGLKDLIQETEIGWKIACGQTNLKKALIEIYNGMTINKTKITLPAVDKFDEAAYNTILTALKKDPDLKALRLTPTKKRFTVADITAKELIKNNDKIIYDDDSEVIVKYNPDKYPKEDDIKLNDPELEIEIAHKPIGEAKILSKLKENAEEYKFFDAKENDAIREYIAKKLENEIPTDATIRKELTDLHNTSINDKTEKGKALRKYLMNEARLNDKIQDKYATYDYKLTAEKGIKDHIAAIHTELKIDEKAYARRFQAVQKTKEKMNELNELDITTAHIKDFGADDEVSQIDEVFKDLDQQILVKKIKVGKEAAEKLTAQMNKKDQLIQDANNALQEKIKENDAIKAENKALKDDIKDYKQYMTDTFTQLELKQEESIDDNFTTLQDKLRELFTASPGASTPDIENLKTEISNKDTEINKLRTEKQTLENTINTLTKEKKNLENANKALQSTSKGINPAEYISIAEITAFINEGLKDAGDNGAKINTLNALMAKIKKKIEAISKPLQTSEK